MLFCVRCRTKTGNLNEEIITTGKNRRMKAECVDCGCNKSSFIGNGTATKAKPKANRGRVMLSTKPLTGMSGGKVDTSVHSIVKALETANKSPHKVVEAVQNWMSHNIDAPTARIKARSMLIGGALINRHSEGNECGPREIGRFMKIHKETIEQKKPYPNITNMSGAGMFDFLNELRTKLQPRANFPPAVRAFIERHGDKKIKPKSFMVGRHLIGANQTIQQMKGLFKIDIHDKLFHLAMIFELEDGTQVSYEKNDVLSLKLKSEKFKQRPDTVLKPTKWRPDHIKNPPTLREFIDKHKLFMGKDYYPYNSFTTNCQQFVIKALRAWNIEADEAWIKQDLSHLKDSWLDKLSKIGTDLKSIKSNFQEGIGMKAECDPFTP